MNSSRNIRLSFVVVAVLLSGSAVAQNVAPSGRVPAQEAHDLNDRKLDVPADLSGQPSLWIVAFEQNQQPQVDRLLALLAPLRRARPALQYWEVAVIEDPGAIIRSVIDAGMKMAIGDPAERRQVVTLYVANQAEWRAVAGFSFAEEAVIAVVRRDGLVIGWRRQSEVRDSAALAEFVGKMSRKL